MPLRVSVGSGSSLWSCFQSTYREFNRELLVTDLGLSFFHSFLSILHSFCGSLFELTSHLLPHYSFQSGLKSSANYGCVATLKMTCGSPGGSTCVCACGTNSWVQCSGEKDVVRATRCCPILDTGGLMGTMWTHRSLN